MLNYIGYTGTANGFNTQKILEAYAAGPLYEIPGGGPVALAIGAAYRDERGGFRPDPITATGDTTGNKEEPTEGGYDVKAAFAELSVVPVKDKPFAKSVELSGAMRAFQFDSFGSDFTWKTGALWSISHGASIRGTYSTSFRAPSIGSLFAGTSDSFPSVSDPCDTSQGPRSPTVDANCRADGLPDDYVDDRTQIRSRVGGNPDLEPETAKVFTLGTVWKVPWVKGLSATIDYWNIEVDNAIVPQGASVILSNCYAQPTRANCDKIIRDSNGFITDIVDLQSNIGGTATSGVDLALRYDQAIEGIGRMTYNLEGTWLHKFNEIQPARTVEGKGVYDLGVNPDFRFNLGAMWNKDAFGAGANFRYIDGFRECEDNDCSEDNPYRNVDINMTADLFASYTQKSELGRSMLTVGVNNFTDANPAVIYNGFLATSDASTYDFLGRFIYMRFSQEY
jgi:outer membrane receptor protein involved in Fe transport